MTNKDKSTEKLRALIGTKQIYRIHFTYGNEMRFIYVVADRSELSSSAIYNGFSCFKEYYDEYHWRDKLVKPQDHAIDWKITTMYIKLADLESVEIDENMEAYI